MKQRLEPSLETQLKGRSPTAGWAYWIIAAEDPFLLDRCKDGKKERKGIKKDARANAEGKRMERAKRYPTA